MFVIYNPENETPVDMTPVDMTINTHEIAAYYYCEDVIEELESAGRHVAELMFDDPDALASDGMQWRKKVRRRSWHHNLYQPKHMKSGAFEEAFEKVEN